ncbi:MAG: hypothetical protein IIA88_00440 [Bacteroidetes bacterium]|nr:hypothetical protein [Bacteroidota bacterium]
MFKEIFLFELKYRFKRPANYIYFGIFFLMTFLAVNGMAGAFKGVVISVGSGGGGKVLANAPFQINILITLLSYFGILVTSAIMGNPVYRDFEHQTHSLFYSKPISKFGYLAGRFLGSLVIVFLVFSGLGIGILTASWMPWLDQDYIGPFYAMAYVQPYLVTVLPNLIFTGAIFFALATLTRNILSTYVGSVVVLVLYFMGLALLSDLENETIAALLDPFGESAIGLATKYWTVAEKNTLIIPFTGLIFLNRIIWLSAGVLIFAFAYKKFSFSYFISEKRSRKKLKQQSLDRSPDLVDSGEPVSFLQMVQTTRVFSFSTYLIQYIKLTGQEFKGIVKNVYFIAILFAGVVLMFVNGSQVGTFYGTTTYPVTYQVISIISGSFTLFFLIIIIFYAGELVWRERTTRINQIFDALPIPNWVPFSSKLTALILLQVVLLAVVMLCGLIIQVFKGYYHFEIGLYVKSLFGLQFIDYALLCVLAMLVQVIVNHKYLGHFIMVVYFLVSIFMTQFGWEHKLYDYADDPGYTYSDMNGFGHFIMPVMWFKIYWVAFAVLLAILSNLFWVRGLETSIKWRAQLARRRFVKPAKIAFILALLVFFISGGFIFYNTNIINEYMTGNEREELSVEYEKRYKKFENSPQPRITDVNVNVDIYPLRRDFAFKGYYILKNKTNVAIDSIHIDINREITINNMSFDRDHKVVLEDEKIGYYIVELSKPLLPGESIKLQFDLAFTTKGFKNSGSNTSIVENGTFLHSNSYLPAIGYNAGGELRDDDTRKKHGLKPKERMALVNDSNARLNNYISHDADWIDFETTISTSPDQIAIAPGYLQREWTEGNRRYFHYKMDCKILNFYSFLSAKYEVKRDNWNNINIEIYYHKGHEYNLDAMIKAIKRSLDYYTENFSPYQHKQVRILEFPRYASFAQSFPNTIPYSEAIGFIALVEDDEDDIDYPFYVTAHEVAHQWWAHQVIGGNVQGATVMSETMAQYSALMVMEKEFGKEKMKRFLKYELDGYLRGRSFERKKELPLILVENQGYIHYQKGGLVMYALRDYIGEDSLNEALKKYIKAVAYQQPPYTNSLEFLSYIKSATPDSLQYIIKDMFETITLYENKTDEAVYEKRPDGKYAVKLKVSSKKLRADSLGNEKEIPVNDWIDIGVFGKPELHSDKPSNSEKSSIGKPLYLKKHKINQPEMEFEIIVDELPWKAGIDPYNKLIDRDSEDNVKKVVL